MTIRSIMFYKDMDTIILEGDHFKKLVLKIEGKEFLKITNINKKPYFQFKYGLIQTKANFDIDELQAFMNKCLRAIYSLSDELYDITVNSLCGSSITFKYDRMNSSKLIFTFKDHTVGSSSKYSTTAHNFFTKLMQLLN